MALDTIHSPVLLEGNRMSRRFIGIALTSIVVLAACSGETSPVCDDLAQLGTSVDALQAVELDASLPTELQGALDAVQADLEALKASATDEVGDEVGALESSLQELSGTAETLTEAPDPTTIAAVGAELADTKQAWDALVAALPDCDS
jgi:hypothetical protein